MTTNRSRYYGGSELWWRETARRLRAEGHEVSILIKNWDPAPVFLESFRAQGIKVFFVEKDGLARQLELRPDIVAVSIGDQDEGTDIYNELRRRGVPYVIVNRLTKEARFWPIRHSQQNAVKAGYLGAEKVFFASANNHIVMQQRLGVPLPKWGRIFSPSHADRSKPLPFPSMADGVRIAFPANIVFQHKGHDLLVDVLARQRWRHRNLVVNVYGEGPDEAALRELIARHKLENIRLRGRIVHPDQESGIAAIWAENHAIIAPSRMEGFANMVLHAMVSGRVPIVTDVGGHGEIIQDGVTGFLAKDVTADDLDAAMEHGYALRASWETIGLAARRAALDYLPPDPVADAAGKLIAVALELRASQGRTQAAAALT